MKKTNQPGQPNDSSQLIVSVILYQAPLLKKMVEKLAHRRLEFQFSGEVLPLGLRPLDTTTIEAYVSGRLGIEENDEYLALDYTTCFSFTCTRELGGDNLLSWRNSLS